MELLIRLVALAALVHLAVHILNMLQRRKLARQCEGRIAWIDVETTGLDTDVDEVLEVAVVMTDMQGNELDVPRFGTVLPFTEQGKERLANNDYVLDMHAKSKLLTEVRLSAEFGEPRNFEALEAYLHQHANRAYMAGLSCHFDRAMLKGNGVDLSMLHHRMIDVTSIDLALQAAGRPSIKPEGEAQHRALSDSLAAIESYRRHLRGV